MKFSVIVPVYNTENYLKKCLDSILNQTYNNIEIICVNDGSTDSSLEILNCYKDERIKIINQENKGALMARNQGIKAATGDYLSFVDSDDWIEIDMYEKLNNYICEYKNPDIVRFNYILYPENKESSNMIGRNNNPYLTNIHTDDVYNFLISTTNLNVLSRGIFKRELFINNTIEERVTASNDVLQMYMILDKAKNALFVDDIFYHYNFNPNSIVHTVNIERVCSNLSSMLFFRNKSVEYLKKWNIYNDKNLKTFAISMINYETSTILKVINGKCTTDELIKVCDVIFNNKTHNEMIKFINKKDINDSNPLKSILKKSVYSKKYKTIKLFRRLIQFKNKLKRI